MFCTLLAFEVIYIVLPYLTLFRAEIEVKGHLGQLLLASRSKKHVLLTCLLQETCPNMQEYCQIWPFDDLLRSTTRGQKPKNVIKGIFFTSWETLFF